MKKQYISPVTTWVWMGLSGSVAGFDVDVIKSSTATNNVRGENRWADDYEDASADPTSSRSSVSIWDKAW